MARRYSRDNRGRFASGGSSSGGGGKVGATARGGRLRTAAGNKRATQTTKATAAKPSGSIAGKVKRNPAAAGKIGKQAKPQPRRPDQAEVNIKGRFTGQAGKRMDASIDRAVKQVKASERARLMKPKEQVKAERAARAEVKRQAAAAKPKRTRTAESLRASRAKQIEKRRSITTNPAGERASAAAKMAANAARTQQRATAFLKAGGTAKPAAPKAAKPASKVDTSMSGLARRRARANAPRNSTYLSQKLNTRSAITRSAANAIYNEQRKGAKTLFGSQLPTQIAKAGLIGKGLSGSKRERAEANREAARKRVLKGKRR